MTRPRPVMIRPPRSAGRPRPRVLARQRPPRADVAQPREDLAALSKPEVLDRWNAGIRAAEGSSAGHVITIYDVIGYDYWSGGITLRSVDYQLRAIGDAPVEVLINSPGGDMFEGIGIYNRLLQHPGKVTVKVMGLAASAASIIAMAGDEVLIGAASSIMIHNAWVLVSGNRHELEETATWLAPFDAAMADVYVARTGQAKADVEAWMDQERYFVGASAIENGFADALLEPAAFSEDAAAAKAAADYNAVRKTELALARSMSRREARSLINKIKGTPGAAPDATPGAGDMSWIGAAADLNAFLKS